MGYKKWTIDEDIELVRKFVESGGNASSFQIEGHDGMAAVNRFGTLFKSLDQRYAKMITIEAGADYDQLKSLVDKRRRRGKQQRTSYDELFAAVCSLQKRVEHLEVSLGLRRE